MNNTTTTETIRRTNLGFRIFPDLTYKFTVISGVTHVDEYENGKWVAYLGTVPTEAK